ncbi:hypothetical protein MWMV7_MWMV7_00042 [Acinetobacter calcoaceticus]|uniref:Uncharacterized protein n=1 Tax=Acinetobacter calcoaceticus TaxID=471 RepID=A0A446ZKZ7_ACICA|nr:hypothetical protein MWMV7_MWMV7_00042 [Acinetobacter calcoaceticus]VAX45184.1 Uncharacterised protein [Acinetobacter calcoaceticus]
MKSRNINIYKVPTPNIETPEVGFFGRNELPPISTARVTEEQIQKFFDYLELIPEVTQFD